MEQFNHSDIKFIKQQPWWNACTTTPYLVKGGVIDESYVLLVTNLKQTWALKANKETILREKELYNKSIQTSSFSGILDLLEKCICSYDANSLYQFTILNNQLLFDYSSVLKIYPIKWQFKLLPIKENHHFDLLCEDLINPLIRTIQSLEQRCLHYKQALIQAEKEMVKRMNDKEKSNFQSKVEDSEEDWKIFIQPRMDKTFRLSQFQFTPQTNFYMKTYSSQKFEEKLSEPKKRQVAEEQKQTQINKKEMIMQAYEQSLQELFSKKDQSELQLVQEQSEPQKKKKKNLKKFL